MLTRILAVVWSILVVWTCTETVYTQAPDGRTLTEPNAPMSLVVSIVFWLIGLGALALARTVLSSIAGDAKSVVQKGFAQSPAPANPSPGTRSCSSCNRADISPSFDFCPGCGASLSGRTCAACKRACIPLDFVHCPGCGAGLG